MNSYLRSLFTYFENVIHPAEGPSENTSGKPKKKTHSLAGLHYKSPESVNIRGSVKKQDKARRNPAP